MPLLAEPAPASEHDLTPEDRATLGRVRADFEAAEKFKQPYNERFRERYGLYRNHRKFSSQITRERDRDAVVLSMKKEWGADLFIPRTFATIETIVPRALANDPRMLAKPYSADAPNGAKKAVEQLFARDQSRIDYEITLQAVARDGFIYGIGAQKTYWHRKARPILRNVKRTIKRGYKTIEDEEVDEGPQAEWVDIFDLLWQPTATSMRNCGWIIHRLWRSFDYVRQKIESGQWFPVDLDAVKRGATGNKYGEQQAERAESHGLTVDAQSFGALHEIWEYHTPTKVCTILDQRFVVQEDENPAFHGQLPFQVFRPTIIGGEFVGISEVEPTRDLQYELNTLRGQRRDAATIALNRPIFYQEGMVEETDLVYGPGLHVPTLGNPREIVSMPDIGDVPGSAYQEAQEIIQDFDHTTGISDAVVGGGQDAADTATGFQMQMSVANVRIRLKVKNLEREVIRHAARQWLHLYKQHLLEKDTIRVDDPDAEEGYSFVDLDPEMIHAIEDVEPEGGSTEPDNPPERQQKATVLYNQFKGDPNIDQRQLATHFLKEFEIRDAEGWLTPPQPEVPPEFVAALGKELQAAGLPEEAISAMVQSALGQLSAGPPQEGQPPPEGEEQMSEEPQSLSTELAMNGSANGGPPEPAASPIIQAIMALADAMREQRPPEIRIPKQPAPQVQVAIPPRQRIVHRDEQGLISSIEEV